ncbi:MAG: hypothetical protein IKG39_12855 [Lachnospiraceae bacterium]|nr:hypothetical protein [Lachnospiraceae bacterium]
MAEWNFPAPGDCQVKGVADAGIENFNGTELQSLAREICQNSLDAAQNDDNPNVIVEFERYKISTEEIPGIQEYRAAIDNCKKFWDMSESVKAKHFLKTASNHLNAVNDYVLRISDYNTIGLSDPYDNDPNTFKFDGWNSLVKIDGGANKGDDKAGAYGIGKNAPFCNSYYRLVFYRTLNTDGERASQGIARILSYPKDLNDQKKTMTTSIGYYGNPDGNMPEIEIPELEKLNIRDETGTDVFIYGFNGSGIEDAWKHEIESALLENFLMSIYRGNLTVRIGGNEINKNTLSGFVGRSASKGTYGNYLALTRTEEQGAHSYSKNFHGLGTLNLRLIVDPKENLDKKVLIVRKAGMKLFRLGNLSKLVPFSGVLELEGKKLNEYFREMESVAHDNWVPGRHSNPKEAKQYFEEIKEWIREIIAGLAEFTSDDEMEVTGLGGVLQDEPMDMDRGDDSKQEDLNDHLGTIDVIQRPESSSAKGFYYGSGQEGNKNVEKVQGTLGKDGEPGVRTLKGKKPRKTKTSHKGTPNPEGADIVLQRSPGGESSCPLSNVRVMKQDNRKYTVCFGIPYSVSSGRIEIAAIGENGKKNTLRIVAADAETGCEQAYVRDEKLLFSGMKADTKVRINIQIAEARDYAMEVNVYEHN